MHMKMNDSQPPENASTAEFRLIPPSARLLDPDERRDSHLALHREASVLECPLRLKTRAAGSFQSLALQEKTGFPFERERVCVCVAVRESCGVACEPFAPTIAPVRGSRQ